MPTNYASIEVKDHCVTIDIYHSKPMNIFTGDGMPNRYIAIALAEALRDNPHMEVIRALNNIGKP